MRILLVGDIHSTLRRLDRLASAAPDYDLTAIAGDFLDVASEERLARRSVDQRERLAQLQQPVHAPQSRKAPAVGW